MGIFFSAPYKSNARLDGNTALITGGNTGIGKSNARDFYERGARVIIASRDLQKANLAIDDIKRQCNDKKNLGELEAVHLDLTSLKSVRTCAEKLLNTEEKINLLINNAGVMMCPYSKTEDGYETQFATNHLGHFLLTVLLIPKILNSTPARIVNVSSWGHSFVSCIDFSDLNWENKKYYPMGAYSQSKLANILFTKELANKLKENNIQGVNVYSVHPGMVKTNLGRHVSKQYFVPGLDWFFTNFGHYIFKNTEQGAQTQIYCSVDDRCANETGLYYSDCKVTEPSAAAKDQESAKQLWEISLKMAGFQQNYNAFK